MRSLGFSKLKTGFWGDSQSDRLDIRVKTSVILRDAIQGVIS